MGFLLGSIVVMMIFAPWSLVTALRASASGRGGCTLFASTKGTNNPMLLGRRWRRGRGLPGSLANPFATPQRLLQALGPGQTGCLRRGKYFGEVRFSHGGTLAAPITLRSFPGERATLAGGYVYVPIGSDYVTLADLRINGSGTTQVSVQIFGSHDALIGDNITNHHQHNSCIIMGYPGSMPYPTGTIIEDNVIHQCGNAADGNKDHAIYFSQSIGAVVTNNLIWGTAAYALHLYPDAQGNAVTHNVIDGNGYGAIFAGSSWSTSSGNVVAHNIIANSGHGYDVQSFWAGAVGTSNVFEANCMYNRRSKSIQHPTTGFTAIGNIIAHPGFVDAAKHDFSLRAHSRCLRVVGYDSDRLLRNLLRATS
jgi:hypothetical protein